MKTPPNSTNPSSEIPSASAVEELLRAGKALGTVIDPPPGHSPLILRPEGYVLEPVPLAPLRPLPDHIRQQVELLDAESFIAYFKAFRTSTARLFCAPLNLELLAQGRNGGARFTAVLDYHAGGDGARDAEFAKTAPASAAVYSAARRLAHVATYPVPLSLEFTRWMLMNGKGTSQMDFVAFIEAHQLDVVSPDSATLLELALNFEAKISVNFQSKVERVTGGRNLIFQETVDAGGGSASVDRLRVPEMLSLRLPLFEGGKLYEMKARMEYRPQNGKLSITYHLQQPHQVFRAAWQQLRDEIADALEIQVLTGSPALHPGWDEVK